MAGAAASLAHAAATKAVVVAAGGPVAPEAMAGAAASLAQAALDDQVVPKISPAAKALESIIAERVLATANDGVADAEEANTSASADSPLSVEEVDYTPSASTELDDMISPRSTVSIPPLSSSKRFACI